MCFGESRSPYLPSGRQPSPLMPTADRPCRSRLTAVVVLVAATVTGAACARAGLESYVLVISNGKIVDGTGNPWYLGDVGVRGDRIVTVDAKVPVELAYARHAQKSQGMTATTMAAEHRTLLQVNADEAALADQVCSVLMGEDVESRKHFIATNAKDVRFLDI